MPQPEPQKNPLDEIVDDLVVFKHEDPNHSDGQYFSNHPMWADSRVRDHWKSRHSEEAVASRAEAAQGKSRADQTGQNPDEDLNLLPAYEDMTNDALRAELVSRNLSVEGKKSEMVARLKADDAEDDETE